MQTYATVADYRIINADNESTDNEIMRLIISASIRAEDLTFGRLKALSSRKALTPHQKECVRNFVCYQAAYQKENGTDGNGDISSYTVGSISVTVKSRESEADVLCVSSQALSCLESSGLRWRGA